MIAALIISAIAILVVIGKLTYELGKIDEEIYKSRLAIERLNGDIEGYERGYNQAKKLGRYESVTDRIDLLQDLIKQGFLQESPELYDYVTLKLEEWKGSI